MAELLQALIDGLPGHGQRPAFHIAGTSHSYAELDAVVRGIRELIRSEIPAEENIVGLLAEDDLRTYAAILALWAEGRAYVPLAPGSPAERNLDVIAQSGIRTVLSPVAPKDLPGVSIVRTDRSIVDAAPLPALVVKGTANAYLLFTSGTTGRPEGVPITRDAVSAFVDAFDRMGFEVGPEDRCLQMFELTFDLSVMSYLVPLLKGACVYTIPKDALKYTYIHELLEDHRLTVALMVPSILNYLRPYFDEVQCPALRVNLFCGEALPLDVLREWSTCVPNARLVNVYGPTEHTIFCTAYEYDRAGDNKERNGVLAIGRPMHGTFVAIIDAAKKPVGSGEQGELCLAGAQATLGYWNDPALNAERFIHLEDDKSGLRYYRTGDLCEQDAGGDLLYIGRTDHQVKIQGFRVELAEVEHHARRFLDRQNAVALAVQNTWGNTELALVVEGDAGDDAALARSLKAALPAYMVPSRILRMNVLPLNTNGKIDRPALRKWAQSLAS